MKYHHLPFSDGMVRAILDGRKTQTRRVVKIGQNATYELGSPRKYDFDWDRAVLRPHSLLQLISLGKEIVPMLHVPYKHKDDEWELNPEDDRVTRVYPKIVTGDRLWVREAWNVCPEDQCIPGEYTQVSHWNRSHRVVYRATVPSSTHPDHPEWGEQRWRSSVSMPRWASRIELEAVSVRAERLQDISEEDAIAEGCVGWKGVPGDGEISLVEAYARLWESINGKKAPWASNPFVLRIEFKKVTP